MGGVVPATDGTVHDVGPRGCAGGSTCGDVSGTGPVARAGAAPATCHHEPVTEDEVRWLSADEQTSWRAYLRANRELDVALDRDLQAVGVSISEYELLSMLSEAPGGRLRMSALAGLIVQSRSRVTHTAARLERRGWVRRTPAPDDGRGVLLELTDEGRRAVERFARRARRERAPAPRRHPHPGAVPRPRRGDAGGPRRLRHRPDHTGAHRLR